MTMELGLLLLESFLLIATIILLTYSIHEGKQRDNLLREVGRATRILTRQEYFFTLLDTMLDAQREIVGCITGSAPSGDDIKMTRNIAATIERMTGKGVHIKYLLPKFPDRLQVGVQYAKAGAEVRFSSCLMVHSIRYSIIDEKIVVFGIPESTGEKEATKKGYKIPSEELAMILKNYFNSCEKQTTLKEYFQEIIEQTGATPEHIAREFHLDGQDLKQFAQ
ncbi:MAG: phospholipase D-like domain-containing protein [Syntrophales bacterium]